MRLKVFIEANREQIDEAIRNRANVGEITNRERELWILNDETLYLWAKSEGVKI